MIIKNQCKAYNSFIAMLRRENRIWIVFKAMVIGYCKQNQYHNFMYGYDVC